MEFAAELYDFIQKDAVHYYPDLVAFVSVTIVEAFHHLLGSFNGAIVSYVEVQSYHILEIFSRREK